MAPAPPADIHQRRLPLLDISSERIFRVHLSAYPAVYLQPRPARYRYDDPAGAYGVMYCAETLEACLLETLVRNPQLDGVARGEITRRSSSVLTAGRALSMVDFCGAGLAALGTDAGVNTGRYPVSQQWSAALYHHPEQPDGIAYRSRVDPSLRCLAVFARPGVTWSVASSSPLDVNMAAAVLIRYGKALF